MKKIIILFFLVLLSSCGKPLYSEVDTDNRNQIIRGKVIGNLVPAPGVDITVEGTKLKTQTDFDGFYSVKVNEQDILIFESACFATQEVFVRGKDTINIDLEEDENFIKNHTIMVR